MTDAEKASTIAVAIYALNSVTSAISDPQLCDDIIMVRNESWELRCQLDPLLIP